MFNVPCHVQPPVDAFTIICLDDTNEHPRCCVSWSVSTLFTIVLACEARQTHYPCFAGTKRAETPLAGLYMT